MSTAEIGFNTVYQKIKSIGAASVVQEKVGNKRTINFIGLNGKKYKVTTRTKKSGTWQTSIDYGVKRAENKNETEYWVFVDISRDPAAFYIVPLWWIQNDIHKVHSEYLEKNDGKRVKNNQSKHHSINKKRIEKWLDSWDQIGLSA